MKRASAAREDEEPGPDVPSPLPPDPEADVSYAGPPLSAEQEGDEGQPAGALPSTYIPFSPWKIGAFTERFYRLAVQLGLATSLEDACALIRSEASWTAAQGGAPGAALRYRASLSVLADLLEQGWEWRYARPYLEVAPPNFTAAPHDARTLLRQKDEIRQSMEPERLAQLRTPTTIRFLQEMETPRRRGDREISILDLVADGEELAKSVRALEHVGAAERGPALEELIQPYLQLIAGDTRCEETGYRLIDIWRYFRYTWSLPYFSTPGRNLFYLVRDAARPFHPVIGIAALGNSIVRLADRERWVGWCTEEITRRLAAAGDEEGRASLRSLARAMEAALQVGISQVNPRGLVSAAEIARPSEAVIQRLVERARESADKRVAELRSHEQDLRAHGSHPVRKRPRGPEETPFGLRRGARDVTAADRSVESLFDQKRASDLADLLRAKAAFVASGIAEDPVAGFTTLLGSEHGQRALGTAIRATKRQHIGTSIMDVIICGAVPPYTHLLGGKLVCMLLASPQVRLEYRQRYSDAHSAIASKMKGAPVAKPADLVFLGTTSLYHVGSSQYNRVKIPASVAGGEGTVRYERLGTTRGYGSVHFGEATRRLLEEAARDERGALLVTRTFGEGVSPKLRLMREGLEALGLNQDAFLQHQCRRIIYGVPLARNAAAYLRGEAPAPDWYFPAATLDEGQAASEAIGRFWVRRWLAGRVQNPAVLQRVALSRPEDLRMTAAAERGLGSSPSAGIASGARVSGGTASGPSEPPPSAGPLGVAFIQQLYNHRSCYADRLTGEQLAAIHIETPLERYISERLHRGDDVILTGNPGDGKTHLLRRLETTLTGLGAECHLDATAEPSYDVIIDAWRKARRRRKPFCLAVNEWPLLEIVRDYEASFPPLASVRAQVNRTIVYDGDAPAPDGVVVIDLNNRSLVDRQTVADVVNRLTDDRFYSECTRCPGRETCAVPRARASLRTTRVQDRLYGLLDLAVRRGAHATMRDLQGYVAFLITRGWTCKRLLQADEPAAYCDLAFEGESDLFRAVAAVFDPVRITHPAYDEALWDGTIGADGWLDPTTALLPPPVTLTGVDEQLQAMQSLKRRFYFEHAAGDRLLTLLPPDERTFDEILQHAESATEATVRTLVGLINRFFDPRERSDADLRIWTTHHYDARWSPTYLSTRALGVDALRLYVPRLAPHVAGAFAFRPDHALLVARAGADRIGQLRVDLALIRALHDAKRGLPMALRSPEVLKRLELFFSGISRAVRTPRSIEDIHIKNFESGADLHLKVDRQHRRYAL